MKKNFTFMIYALLLAVFFILTGAFSVGSVNMPKTYWLSSVAKDGEGEIENSFITLDLDREFTVTDEDGKTSTVDKAVSGIYLYIGKIYDDSDVTVYFDFKTKKSPDTSYVKEVKAEGIRQYSWNCVYDGTKEGLIEDLSRVKIRTPNVFELYEVVFTTEDGEIIKIEKVADYYKYSKTSAENVMDEQGRFTTSSAYRFNLSDDELSELNAADALLRGGNAVGEGIFTTFLNALSVSIFGRNTFGIRFVSLLFGYVAFLIFFLLLDRIFANDVYALIGSLTALFMCAMFKNSVTASLSVGTAFILLAYYLAIGFFAEIYKFRYKKETVLNLVFTGVSIGLAVVCGASNVLFLLGIPVIWGIALKKLNTEYKVAYEEEKGLKKESIYTAYHDKKARYTYLLPLAFLVIPIVLLFVFYAVSAGRIKEFYEAGFILAMLKDMGASFGFKFSISRLGLFVGKSKDILNYVPFIASLIGFIFTTSLFFAPARSKAHTLTAGIKVKHSVLIIMLAFGFIPLLFGLTNVSAATAFFACVYSAFVPLALSALGKNLRKRTLIISAIAIGAVCLITFVGCYIGICGFKVSEVLAKILYGWQL